MHVVGNSVFGWNERKNEKRKLLKLMSEFGQILV
jgi:hypothetical protein